MKLQVTDVLRYLLTLIVIGIMIWWLLNVLAVQGTEATKNADTGLLLDPWSRAKEILSIILPLVTLTLGYWFGVKGADQAEKTAAIATEQSKQSAVVAAEATQAAGLLAGLVPEKTFQEALAKYPNILGPKKTT